MDIKRAWLEVCKGLGAVAGTVKGGIATDEEFIAWEAQDFFSSYETSYSMTLAYPEDLLIQSAKAAGIQTAGRSKLEIVEDMVKLQRQQE